MSVLRLDVVYSIVRKYNAATQLAPQSELSQRRHLPSHNELACRGDFGASPTSIQACVYRRDGRRNRSSCPCSTVACQCGRAHTDLRFGDGDLAIGHLHLRYDFVRQSASWHRYEWRPAPYSVFRKPCHAPFLKKKNRPISGKLHAARGLPDLLILVTFSW